jgi:hypothetical protein
MPSLAPGILGNLKRVPWFVIAGTSPAMTT